MPRSKNASKAYRRFRKTYGKVKGTSIYWKFVNKKGKGKTRAAKERSAFKKKK